MSKIESLAELRQSYLEPKGRTLEKVLPALDPHCRHFIALSRFVVISTSDSNGNLDASPRGGEPGFVDVFDDHTVLIPDWPGNNRLDSFQNILDTGKMGLLFMIAGVDETLRINGDAELRCDEALRERCSERGRLPKLVIQVSVREAFLHCAKALMRSKLWDQSAQTPRDSLPSMGEMISDQISSAAPHESQTEMIARYEKQLY